MKRSICYFLPVALAAFLLSVPVIAEDPAMLPAEANIASAKISRAKRHRKARNFMMAKLRKPWTIKVFGQPVALKRRGKIMFWKDDKALLSAQLAKDTTLNMGGQQFTLQRNSYIYFSKQNKIHFLSAGRLKKPMQVKIGDKTYAAGRARRQGFMQGDVAFGTTGALRMIITPKHETITLGKNSVKLYKNSQLWFDSRSKKLSTIYCARRKRCTLFAGKQRIPVMTMGVNNTGEFFTYGMTSRVTRMKIKGKRTRVKKYGQVYLDDKTGDVLRAR